MTSLSLARPISPWLEMGAYECLWTKAHQTFKRISEMFQSQENSVPSDFILPEVAEGCASEVADILRRSSIGRFGIRLRGTADYPVRLSDAKYPVQLFYFQGWWDLVDTRCVAVVGTRKPSDGGTKATDGIVRGLVKDGYTVVSGLAAGIDTVAHRTAIDTGGRTIAVIGTPLSVVYPSENDALQRKIASDFLIISQIPVIRYSRQDWKSNRSFFPQRNITMSALTEATIIVEASDTSGTLMQARAAIEQRRKLFILD
ncbi:MAG: DNA-processing protein DprA, partial [Candidatus Korobacteraceae bacterium]